MKEFVEIVKKMREAQKEFFDSDPRTKRRNDALRLSKKYERLVDKFIDDIEVGQKSLF